MHEEAHYWWDPMTDLFHVEAFDRCFSITRSDLFLLNNHSFPDAIQKAIDERLEADGGRRL